MGSLERGRAGCRSLPHSSVLICFLTFRREKGALWLSSNLCQDKDQLWKSFGQALPSGQGWGNRQAGALACAMPGHQSAHSRPGELRWA